MTEDKLNPNTPMEDLTIGGNIYTAGNAKEFKTGDWRSSKPVFIPELCKQCGLCFPVCPEDAIPVNKDLKKDSCFFTNSIISCFLESCAIKAIFIPITSYFYYT